MVGLVCKFLTHNKGKPLTFGVVVDRRAEKGGISAVDYRDLVEVASRHPGACAYGKIVVLADDGVHGFQARPDVDMVPVFCGNSTAAAIGLLGVDGPFRTTVHGPAAVPYDVTARAKADGVVQTWTVPVQQVEERMWRGCRALFLPTLNDYAIVLGELPLGTTPELVRRELLGPAQASKLAVIGGSPGDPVVMFYNANGKHGGVPQTGLATIALAARSISWLAACFPDGRLVYQSAEGPRKARLPAVSDTACGRVAIAMPKITVSLTPLAMDLAA